MGTSLRIAVIGIGGTGSAALRHLAKAGHTAVGFEQFSLGHGYGSSHGESRIIRYTYPDRLYTVMMGDAYPLWAELEAEANEELFVRCGGLLLGSPDHPRLTQTVDALDEQGLAYEWLLPEPLAERFPAMRLEPGEGALFQKESGFLRSTRCVLANARLAQQYGAEIRQGVRVEEIRRLVDGTLTVRDTQSNESVFDRVIVTAGAWMGKLLMQLGMPLSVEQRQVLYMEIARNEAHFEPQSLPVWIDATAMTYGFPKDGVVPGIKMASHLLGASLDPDRQERIPDPAITQEMQAYARRRFPDVSGAVNLEVACLYTLTPDEHFILDQVPELPGVYLVSGCSGHGFKFTVLLGEIAARAVTGGEYPRDLSRFALSRFTSR
jgi:monomeric sarcosine oxidase